MKRIFKAAALTAVVISVFMFPACTLHIPYDWDWEAASVRVILKVDPDDAMVLVNGKWIGEAYEFATPQSAIRLASKHNEIVIKKEGYIEEAIDLFQYASNNITIRLKLLPDKDYVGPPGKAPTAPKPPKPDKPKAKTAPEREIPLDILEKSEQERTVEPVEIYLEILPAEASIYLDGKFWGISPKSGKIENLRLKPGKYTLEIVKPGFEPYKKELDVKEQKLKLSIRLEKK
jgi:hypothetical protein